MSSTRLRAAHQPWWQRIVAAAMLLLLFSWIGLPLAQAQSGDAMLPACCRGMRACSMRMHHAAEQSADTAHAHFGTVTPRCPCAPLAPSNVSAHEMPLLPQGKLLLAISGTRGHPAHAGPALHTRSHCEGDPRGPPLPIPSA